MTRWSCCTTRFLTLSALTLALLAVTDTASAHCDTLDGPVVQDARKAIQAGDITPVLKWVKPKDEPAVRAAFRKLSHRTQDREKAAHEFFATLVKIHRAGEGAPFTGLKPAGTTEPAIAEADKALAQGSTDALVKHLTDQVAAGIKERYARAAAAYRHKEESVARGREFVEAYVEYTHYVERLQRDAEGTGAHHEHGEKEAHEKTKKPVQHRRH